MKDSILNTNPNFDYGQFLSLQQTVLQGGTTVNAFNFLFTQAGIYVFQDSLQTSKVTIIGVVAATQQCSNKDTNVQAVTAASLASIGIVSQTKTVQPNWTFIIGTFVFILVISFGFVNMVIVLHNRNDAQNSQSSSKKHFIYYDLVHQLDKDHTAKNEWWRRFLCCKRFSDPNSEKVLPKAGDNQSDSDITYDDLQRLLKEFRDQMEVLKSKLKDEENQNRNIAQTNEEEDPSNQDEEEELMKELADLREFVNNNKECIEEFFGIQRKDQNASMDAADDLDEIGESQYETPGQQEARQLLNEQAHAEEMVSEKIKEQL